MVPRILILGTRGRWVVSFTPRPLYPVGTQYFRNLLKGPPNTTYSKDMFVVTSGLVCRWGVSTNLKHLQEAFSSSQHQMRIWQCTMNYNEVVKGKVGKVHPVQALRLCTGRTAHRGRRGIALPYHDRATRRGEGSASRRGRPLPQEGSGTHCTGGWVGPRAGLDRCGKSRPHQDSITGPSSP
jgi:hypothetical protein